MADDSVTSLLMDQRPLFPLIYRFNCQPALDTHPDRLADIADPGLVERVCRSPRGERLMSARLARHFALAPEGHWDFHNAALRLAALPRTVLERLITLAGVAALHRPIGRIIEKKPLQCLKQSLGHDVYAFTLKRAPFLTAKADWAASAEMKPSAEALENPRHWVDSEGLKVLTYCWAECPAQVAQRVRIKLSPNLELPAPGRTAQNDREAVFRIIKKMLLQEIEPDLEPCFA